MDNVLSFSSNSGSHDMAHEVQNSEPTG